MKRLYRSRNDRKIAGVLGGVSEYFQMDPTVVRIVYAILFILTSFFPFGLIYLAAIFIIPNEEDVNKDAY